MVFYRKVLPLLLLVLATGRCNQDPNQKKRSVYGEELGHEATPGVAPAIDSSYTSYLPDAGTSSTGDFTGTSPTLYYGGVPTASIAGGSIASGSLGDELSTNALPSGVDGGVPSVNVNLPSGSYGFLPSGGVPYFQPSIVGRHITVHNRVGVPVLQPYPVPFHRDVAVPVPQPFAVPVDRPVAVPVPQPYPVHVVRTVNVPVEKRVPYPVPHAVPYPVYKPVAVPVARPVPVPVVKDVPVPLLRPVVVKYTTYYD